MGLLVLFRSINAHVRGIGSIAYVCVKASVVAQNRDVLVYSREFQSMSRQ